MADDNVTDSSSYKSAPSHISLENADSITSGNDTHLLYNNNALKQIYQNICENVI